MQDRNFLLRLIRRFFNLENARSTPGVFILGRWSGLKYHLAKITLPQRPEDASIAKGSGLNLTFIKLCAFASLRLKFLASAFSCKPHFLYIYEKASYVQANYPDQFSVIACFGDLFFNMLYTRPLMKASPLPMRSTICGIIYAGVNENSLLAQSPAW